MFIYIYIKYIYIYKYISYIYISYIYIIIYPYINIYHIYLIPIRVYLKNLHGMSHFEPSLNPCDPATGRPAFRRTSL